VHSAKTEGLLLVLLHDLLLREAKSKEERMARSLSLSPFLALCPRCRLFQYGPYVYNTAVDPHW
tara:strand:- start:436 stop:627 length:192 start_codon:yes stop_codon:yes gene_type:complete